MYRMFWNELIVQFIFEDIISHLKVTCQPWERKNLPQSILYISQGIFKLFSGGLMITHLWKQLIISQLRQNVLITVNLFMNNYSKTIQSFLPFYIIYSLWVSYLVHLQAILLQLETQIRKLSPWPTSHQPDKQDINDVLLGVSQLLVITTNFMELL